MKTCVILRGVSGSGKSTLAATYKNCGFVVCSADDFFAKDGKYHFDPLFLGLAHTTCRKLFEEVLERGENVVVDNTNTTDREWQPYKKLAESFGYTVLVVVVQNHNDTTSVHDVPELALERQKSNLVNSIISNF